MKALGYITSAIKELFLQVILFFDSFDYSAIFTEDQHDESEKKKSEKYLQKDATKSKTDQKLRELAKPGYGQLRFSLAYLEEHSLLHVTIVDVWDLPPMDDNGLADPYVEVSLRTKSSTLAQDKFKTTVKNECLSAIFNESADIPLELDDINTGELVIKVMDCDFDLPDEVIGTIRLPLSYLQISSISKQHTCLILHDTNGEEGLVGEKQKLACHQMSASTAAALQLEISSQASKIYDLQLVLKSAKDELEEAKEDVRLQKSAQMKLEVENFDINTQISNIKNSINRRQKKRFDVENNTIDKPDALKETTVASTSFDSNVFYIDDDLVPEADRYLKSNAQISNNSNAKAHLKCHDTLKCLRQTMEQKDDEIKQLKNYLSKLEPFVEYSANGQIEVGLLFSHVSSRLSIKILSANKLKTRQRKECNPYAKIKVAHRSNSGRPTDRFATKTIKSTTSPIWNDEFEIENVEEDDLIAMSVEITLLSRRNHKQHKHLGRIRIGPNQLHDNQHWEKMTKQHGTLVTMIHNIGEV